MTLMGGCSATRSCREHLLEIVQSLHFSGPHAEIDQLVALVGLVRGR